MVNFKTSLIQHAWCNVDGTVLGGVQAVEGSGDYT